MSEKSTEEMKKFSKLVESAIAKVSEPETINKDVKLTVEQKDKLKELLDGFREYRDDNVGNVDAEEMQYLKKQVTEFRDLIKKCKTVEQTKDLLRAFDKEFDAPDLIDEVFN